MTGTTATSEPSCNTDVDILAELANAEDVKNTMAFIQGLQAASLDSPDSGLHVGALKCLQHLLEESLSVNDPDVYLSINLYLAISQNTYDAQTIADLTGIHSITHHMCINTCIAYMGPFSKLEQCPICRDSPYDQAKTKSPQQEFHTIPIGPQLQALWHDKDKADQLKYSLRELDENCSIFDSIDDFFHGSTYPEAVAEDKIKSDDIVLMLSMDASDCWIYIWVIFDHPPEVVIIPGPNKPKNSDSFLYPGLYHLSAIQLEGLQIWDSSQNSVFIYRPGMMALNGLVGYHRCCKPHGSHYYPALLKPRNYTMEGCDHDDFSATEHLWELHHILDVPQCFGSDIMHLGAINTSDLIINLWQGMFDCNASDSKETWDWAVLKGDLWENHGKVVTDCTKYLPGLFDHPPRNIAEKINSRYKAWEFLLYLYGLPYWQNHCKLVYGLQIYQTNWLHFIWPCLHSLCHMTLEVTSVGPLICDLGSEICQPSNPYINLSYAGICYLEPEVNELPYGAKRVASGKHVLLQAWERTPHCIQPCEADAIHTYIHPGSTSRNVKVINGIEKTFTLVFIYSKPNTNLLQASYYTLWSCQYQGDSYLRLINVNTISAVVAMILHMLKDYPNSQWWFVVERPGLDVAQMSGIEELEGNNDD
ncbi:hypothetical protein BJV74DRAFT_880059 [Russula compacta]|nr:hypothetical protein BJV74DRAFT_880059 [Russula compacta]